ncbi:glycoside hydrolase family 97 protein [Geofilum rubicundum]|uniref:Alpha-glucosidase n=1 Tax=Geofilum rubicundum JCM 15548 TaxID=1236989 RepID=A0A0E9LXD2_9BACT|nr:glycoside hydrolase family 97 protein [Geofilum rubicundum]GAO29806.1 alpha-glucosidase [Geofilum rubicundum JCM 15548]
MVDAYEGEVLSDLYKKSRIPEVYNALTLEMKGDYKLVFRMYDAGMAYRFETAIRRDITVMGETIDLDFPHARQAWVPYIRESIHRYQASYESPYTIQSFNEMHADSLIILPLLIENENGSKVVITEADLEDYPGFYLTINEARNGFVAEQAGVPLAETPGGHNNLQSIVTEYADYIARTKGTRTFPWRVLTVAQTDVELLDNDLVFLLASPSRIEDTSWIKPGKVAWDWWNDWNISGVDFEAGINTETYQFYIDFAAEHGIEYVILDEGWSESTNLLNIIPEIDLQAIIDHGKAKGVDIVLWAGWAPLRHQMDEVYAKYSAMGVKGYKIDFMNRDDQPVVNFYYEAARKAAEYEQFVDFHGAYKPTGLHRTYPNVLTYEGVFGLEQVKWTTYTDFPRYDVTAPFIRMLAGPMDYTPGAMNNANRSNWRAVHSNPMSQGTRCHQLAMYVIFESPFSMLADKPTNYMRESASTEFIAALPTVFDETQALDGQLGEFILMARRKDNHWYLGAMTNWDERDLEVDFSFLPEGEFEALIFRDGINANREASDYKREVIKVNRSTKLPISMASGGGWAAIVSPE